MTDRIDSISPAFKLCRSCGESKLSSDFGIVRSSHDGLRYSCKACYNAVRKEYRRHSGEKISAAKKRNYYANHEMSKAKLRDRAHYAFSWKLKNVYGMTLDDYLDMLDRQGGRCAICNRKPMAENGHSKKKRLHIDHCHKTGKVRGLLCNSCNIALGCLGDNLEVALSAAEYLRERK